MGNKPKKWTLKNRILDLFAILKDSFKEFGKDNIVKLSSSLAYYTIFSLPPLLLLITSIFSNIISKKDIEGELYAYIGNFLGNKATNDVEQIIQNIQDRDNTTFSAIIGFVTLFIGATAVFTQMQSSRTQK